MKFFAESERKERCAGTRFSLQMGVESVRAGAGRDGDQTFLASPNSQQARTIGQQEEQSKKHVSFFR